MIPRLAASTCAVVAFLLVAHAGNAAPISHSFVGEVVFGPALGAPASGTFSYDDSAITGVGEEGIGVAEGLRIELAFLGQTFVESDDTDFPLFPALFFLNGTPVFLDFIVLNGDGIGTDILAPGISAFRTGDLIPLAGAPGFFTPIETLPVPATLALTLLGTAMLIARRRLASRRD
jgi:hypothetical protein